MPVYNKGPCACCGATLPCCDTPYPQTLFATLTSNPGVCGFPGPRQLDYDAIESAPSGNMIYYSAVWAMNGCFFKVRLEIFPTPPNAATCSALFMIFRTNSSGTVEAGCYSQTIVIPCPFSGVTYPQMTWAVCGCDCSGPITVSLSA